MTGTNRCHVRNEVLTREHHKIVGDGAPLPERLGVGWCGEVCSGQWFFKDAEHVLLTLAHNAYVTPCQNCLRRMQELIAKELAKP
jgi:hypothetical protein